MSICLDDRLLIVVALFELGRNRIQLLLKRNGRSKLALTQTCSVQKLKPVKYPHVGGIF